MSVIGYQHIREQLVTLNVDLDDKQKICAHLAEKIATERAKLSRVEGELTAGYEEALESDFVDRQKEMSRLKSLTDHLVIDKKECVRICQVLVETIRQAEGDIAADGRHINREALEALDSEKRRFRASHPERLQSFLMSKSDAEKGKTERALQPEFSRLQQMHELEIAEAEEYAKITERKMREEFQKNLEELVKEEKEVHDDSHKNLQRNRYETVNTELEASEREHSMRLLTSQSDAEKDLMKLKHKLEGKVEMERKEGQSEIVNAQENLQKRVHELRSRHMTDIAMLMKDHDEQIKALRARAAGKKQMTEQQMIQENGPLVSTSLLEDSESRHEVKVVVGDFMTKQLKVGIQRERDKILQAEIRSLQAASVRLERSWKTKAATERQFVLESSDKEEKESARRQRHLNEETAELMSLHEQFSQDVQKAQEILNQMSNELEDAQKEIDVYDGGISAHSNRMKDMQSLSSARLRDDESTNTSRVETVRARIDRNRLNADKTRNVSERELAELEAHHVTEMEALDKQVKSDVARKDEDLDLLRDAVHSEKVRIVQLEKLMRGHRV